MPDASFDLSIALRVPDIASVRPFYENLVGLETTHESGGRVELGPAGDAAPIVILEEAPDGTPRSSDEAGLFHLAIRFPTRASLSGALRRLREANYGLAGASDHHVSEALYTDDPAGNGVELYVDRPRSEWRRDDQGDIVMTTEPLDIEDLWQAGADERSTPAPAQTRLGHVHLEVTDLADAVSHYRDTLGMDLQAERTGAAFLSYDEYHHHVGLNTWNRRRRPHSAETLGLSAIEARVGPDRWSLLAQNGERPDRTVFQITDPDAIPWHFHRTDS